VDEIWGRLGYMEINLVAWGIWRLIVAYVCRFVQMIKWGSFGHLGANFADWSKWGFNVAYMLVVLIKWY
jgi:hypothetical protein